MKRQRLIQHLRAHGCRLVREGGEHTWVLNPSNGRQTSVPRHREIEAHLARAICKQLGIPALSER